MQSILAGVKSILSTFLFRGIGRRFAVYILLFSSIITLFITAIQLLYDYRRDIGIIEDRLQEIQTIYQDTLSTAIWVHNENGLNLQLDGMMRLPAILYVRLDDELGVKTAQRGKHREQRTIKISFELSYLHRGNMELLGQMIVLADLDVVYKRLFNKLVIILLSQGIKTFLVSLFILLLFQLLIGRHLNTMAAVAREISAGSFKHMLDIGHDDELSDVAGSFNNMSSKLDANMATLKKEVDERRQAQHVLEEYQNHLEEMVQEKTVDLTKANLELEHSKEVAESANKAKSTFLSTMSHELRTPLNAILGFSKILARAPDSTSDQKEKLAIINNSGEHLLRTINDVLDLSKIEAGHMILEQSTVNLTGILHEIKSLMSAQMAKKSLLFNLEQSAELPQNITVDAVKLRRVLINLIANAVKFTAKGQITVRVKIVKQESSALVRLRFEVEDSGIGIPIEDQENIFSPFFQIGEQQDVESGSGLGLAICKQYIELMGGHISVNSEHGKGSLFFFEFPAGVVASSGESPAIAYDKDVIGLEEGQQHYRLLIVEDRMESRLLLRNLLEPLGFSIREAVNGLEAVEQFEQWHPHLIWMDIRMPVMNGKEATKRIKESKAGDNVIIIALTAHALEQERIEILEAGCDDFIRKPYRDTEIFHTLTKHLEVRFLYSKEDSADDAGDEDEFDEDQLKGLSFNLIEDLREAMLLLNKEHSLKAIEIISDYNHDLGRSLRRLVEKLEYSKLITILDNLIESGSR